jgi:O-antigen ligase
MLLVVMTAFGATLFPLRDLVLSRTLNSTTRTEEASIDGRVWLAEQALELTLEHPWTGVGIGSSVIELAKRAVDKTFAEPIHNIPLLILSELGIIGLVFLLAIAMTIGQKFLKSNDPNTIIVGALLMGLGVISLFDHYFWTLAPGRIMLGLTLGLWEAQLARHDA